MKKLCIILTFASILFTSCQTMNNIMANPDYNLLDLAKSKKSFTLNEPFPEKGYKLRGSLYYEIEVQRLLDNDTLYYLKYNPKREARNFYFTVIDKQTVDTLLVNTLSKKETSSAFQRRIWLDKALIELGIEDYQQKKGQWTYFVPKYKMVKGNLPTDIVKSGFHREYEKFNYNTALTKYYEQRHPQEKLSGMEVLGALVIINMLSGSSGDSHRYSCRSCPASFSNQADLLTHQNAYDH